MLFRASFFFHCDYQGPVLPRGRKFGRKTQKGPTNIVWGRESLGTNFWQICQKGPNLWKKEKTKIFASMGIFYEGPNFFASGRIFWLIWPKKFARSWQHSPGQMSTY
jgi:hypothetical protein